MPVESCTYATWLETGDLEDTVEVKTCDLDSALVDQFRVAMKNLSGDIELPYEASLPGEVPHCEYRIGSDLRGGAYVMFYFHDAIAMTSVILQGTDEHHETQLAQTIKCLLLEPDSVDQDEDLTDEELDELLAAEAFNFDSVVQRPAVFSIIYDLEPTEPEAVAFIGRMNLHLAAAFMKVGKNQE